MVGAAAGERRSARQDDNEEEEALPCLTRLHGCLKREGREDCSQESRFNSNVFKSSSLQVARPKLNQLFFPQAK